MKTSEYLKEQFAKASRDEFGHVRCTQELCDAIVEGVEEVERTIEQMEAFAVKMGWKGEKHEGSG